MGKGGFNYTDVSLQSYDWDEIRLHNQKTDRWIVVDDKVYDVTNWCKRHPGGERIISNYAGQDATEAWMAFHINKAYVSKFLKPLLMGSLRPGDDSNCDIVMPKNAMLEDFHKLRKAIEDMGLFTPNVLFFVLIMLHILFFDALGWFTMWYFGATWIPYIVGAVFLTISQVQAGWAQHDYGHLSVFKTSRLNHWTQIFLLNFIKGASCDWWNYRHYNHHAKPNLIRKDPDIRLDLFFMVGKVLPIEWGKKKKGFMPYNIQQHYFFLTLPPLLLTLYFNYEIPYFLISRRRWNEMFWTTMFFVRWQLMFGGLLGFWGVFGLFLFVRFMESHWFVWTTQMSHIPMRVDYDKEDEDWVTMQLKATCNVQQSWFNDWFSGHLNFQIEHHLFPTLPRSSYHKVAPLVRSFCERHGLEYQCKPMMTAFSDIVQSLKTSGELWYEAYNM